MQNDSVGTNSTSLNEWLKTNDLILYYGYDITIYVLLIEVLPNKCIIFTNIPLSKLGHIFSLTTNEYLFHIDHQRERVTAFYRKYGNIFFPCLERRTNECWIVSFIHLTLVLQLTQCFWFYDSKIRIEQAFAWSFLE